MSKSRRDERDARRAQYELPGFAAGVCRQRITHVLFLAVQQVTRYGRTPLLDNLIDELCAVQRDIINWQVYAQMVTDYELAHRATREECE